MATPISGYHPLSLSSDLDTSLSFNSLKPHFTKRSFTTSPLPFSAFISHAHFQKNSPFPSSKPKSKDTSLLRRKTGVMNSPEKSQKLNLQVSPHRAVAAVRLMRIEFGGAFADLLNERGKGSGNNEMEYVERTLGLRTRDLDDRDLRLVTDIVGGTIRWRKYLDYLIVSLCHDESSFRSMEPLLLQILRVGFYEIVKLEMPPYAVVDENVNLAKFALRPGAGNLVNGILRKLVSLKDNDSLPVPNWMWMVRRWTKYLGQEAAIRLMMWNNADPSFSLRANLAKGLTREDLITKLNMMVRPTHILLFIHLFQMVIQNGFLKEGLCSVQDESAGLAVSVWIHNLMIALLIVVLLRGKTLFMASRLNGRGMISAIDVNKGRLRILKEAATLQCVDNVITCIHSDLRSFAMPFDKVLLDAPCSGLGVLSKVGFTLCQSFFCSRCLNCFNFKLVILLKRPDLRWNRKLVKLNGVLVYSTCSNDPDENEERSLHFFLDIRYVPSDFLTEHGFYRSCPVKHAMDGAFAARLVRWQ
ncbi:putative ribosomal RNA small subunit methyltransferase B [Bienertia sinuspersici]